MIPVLSGVFSLSGAREYHVQFFSNQPERAWVHEKRVREYQGHKQYEQLLAEAAKQASNHSEKQKVHREHWGDCLCKGDALGQVWNSSVLCPEERTGCISLAGNSVSTFSVKNIL